MVHQSDYSSFRFTFWLCLRAHFLFIWLKFAANWLYGLVGSIGWFVGWFLIRGTVGIFFDSSHFWISLSTFRIHIVNCNVRTIHFVKCSQWINLNLDLIRYNNVIRFFHNAIYDSFSFYLSLNIVTIRQTVETISMTIFTYILDVTCHRFERFNYSFLFHIPHQKLANFFAFENMGQRFQHVPSWMFVGKQIVEWTRKFEIIWNPINFRGL